MHNIPKIKVESLYKTFDTHKVLDGVSFEVKENSSLVILGGSGTGKSVLIKSIIGLISPDAGSIQIDGVETVGIHRSQRFKILEKFGFLFQGGALFDSLNIQDNVTFLAEKQIKLSKEEKKDLAIRKLASVGLAEKVLHLYPSELSGGMLKRAALARTICNDPEIIFFDEPTTGLDPIMANVINELIIKVRDELGATTVTITHDMNSAKMIATEVALLDKGKVLWSGSKDDMQNSNNSHLYQFINGLTKGPIEV
ncbi:MAG: ATP-binding cassette domain-containing protein [Rickettsiaceae bacterium]|nr:MAG: ATP-binding cassette domain-containing protein [Rickettsiaceae bacterium]